MALVKIGIPTLTCYEKLTRLCTLLDNDNSSNLAIEFYILDNGGKLLQSPWLDELKKIKSLITIETAPYNLGVAPSWNRIIKKLGRCLISNDDATFSKRDIELFLNAAQQDRESIIFDVAGNGGGFNVFFMNRPELWLESGGFDEAFAPAYFEDDDAYHRLNLMGLPRVRVQLLDWSHETSSTLHTSNEEYKRNHWCCFFRNQLYYQKKWGGLPGQELFSVPFNAKQ